MKSISSFMLAILIASGTDNPRTVCTAMTKYATCKNIQLLSQLSATSQLALAHEEKE
jgi:hypothetical protein